MIMIMLNFDKLIGFDKNEYVLQLCLTLIWHVGSQTQIKFNVFTYPS